MTIRDKITQGEWRAFDLHHDGVYPGLELGHEENYIQIDVPDHIPTARANALTISKVPEMLKLIDRLTNTKEDLMSIVLDANELWEELNNPQ